MFNPWGQDRGGVPELKPQAEIVEDYLSSLGRPLARKMAEWQEIAVYPGLSEDLPREDKKG